VAAGSAARSWPWRPYLRVWPERRRPKRLLPHPLPHPLTAAPAPVFAIKGFKITGENPLGDGDTSRILAPYLRADANMDTLQKATSALEEALRAKGFGLHRVALPPQEVGDTVTPRNRQVHDQQADH
jgi:hemolysin activation/secretion protein